MITSLSGEGSDHHFDALDDFQSDGLFHPNSWDTTTKQEMF